MRSVDVSRYWGDEHLELVTRPVDLEIDAELPGPAFRPFERGPDGAWWLTLPPGAAGWVRTISGWRDPATLRVLGCLEPHPELPGATRVRVRPLDASLERDPDVVPVDRIEMWIGRGGWWIHLREARDEPPAPPPRLDRSAARFALAFVLFVVATFAGSLGALASVAPRTASLDLTRLEPAAPSRLPPVRVAPATHATADVETKHEVPPRAAGGGAREATAPIGAARREAGSRAARARRSGDGRSLAALTRASAEVARLADAVSPFTVGAAGAEAGHAALLASAASPGPSRAPRGTAELDQAVPAWTGPLEAGWGGGFGAHRPPRERPLRTRVLPLSSMRFVPICERHPTPGGGWSCHPWPRRRPLGPEVIQRVVRAHLAELRFCYEAGLSTAPGLGDRVTVRFRVEADGHVSESRVVEDGVGDSAVSACIAAAPPRWTFPESRGVTLVEYPFVFRSTR